MKNKDMLSITFLYPSRRVGGAQLLFIRLAIEISKYDNISVSVVDFKDGYLKSQLRNYTRINILPYKNGFVELENGEVVVTPLSNLADLEYMIKGDFSKMKILLWSIHPYALDFIFSANARKCFVNKDKLKKKIKILSESETIVYMDETNYLVAKNFLSLENTPKYLQIPLEVNDFKSKGRIETDILNIAWLGRICDDKFYSIVKIIDEIKLLEHQYNIVFHVIGTGEKSNELELYLKKSEINYVLPGTLINNDLSMYLIENIDLGIALGTSCLEFAIRKIPVVIIDYSEVRFPNEVKYNWLFETQYYTLGRHVSSTSNRNHIFLELLSDLKNDRMIGEKCYQYVLDNHDIKIVALKLIDKCKNLKSIDFQLFKDIQNLLNPYLYKILYFIYRRVRRF